MGNPKNNLHHIMVLQYLVRITSDMENQIREMKNNMDLNNLDAVDIIDYIETLAAYKMATRMERDIVTILSFDLC